MITCKKDGVRSGSSQWCCGSILAFRVSERRKMREVGRERGKKNNKEDSIVHSWKSLEENK